MKIRKYNCYRCGCFDEPPCSLSCAGNTVEPQYCPFDSDTPDEPRWEEEGVPVPFGECLQDGCNGMSTTYTTHGKIITVNCPDCSYAEAINGDKP